MARWAVGFLAGLSFACAPLGSPPSDAPVRTPLEGHRMVEAKPESGSAILHKEQIIREMEIQMRIFLGQVVARFDEIHRNAREEVTSLPVPPKIGAVESELAHFYGAEEDAYEAQVLAIADKYRKEMEAVLDYVDPKVWEIAFQLVGSEDFGVGYGSRTGIDEVDENAQATIDLIHYRSRLSDLEDELSYAKARRTLLDRLYKSDIEGEGRLAIFISDPIRGFFRRSDSHLAATVTYQRRGLDPKIPLEFRQAVRNRIVRGGTTRMHTDFHWDSTLPNPDGRLPTRPSERFPNVVVSEVFNPRINENHPVLSKLRDYIAIRDYKTAVVNGETGEVLDCVSWQYTWQISHFGAVAVEKGKTVVRDEEAEVIKKLLRQEVRRPSNVRRPSGLR